MARRFKPITKYSTQILSPEIVPEIVRKAFKVALTEEPGAAFIDFPENIAEMAVAKKPIEVQKAYTSDAPDFKIEQAAKIISEAKSPVILAGNGVIRQGAADALASFAEVLRIPVANTFMAKGVVPFSNDLSLGTIGAKARDLPWFAFEKADVVICVGYDMVEYHPDMWNPNTVQDDRAHRRAAGGGGRALHRRDGVLGDIGASLRAIALKSKPQKSVTVQGGAQGSDRGSRRDAEDQGFPVKPQKIVWDLREVLAPEDIVISRRRRAQDVDGAHVPAGRPNTCIISNGFASMGIAVPGAIAAKLAYPDRRWWRSPATPAS